jgi:hypothetical protein
MTAITVTADHIAEGVPGECGECPIALAIAEAFPSAAEVAVYASHVNIWKTAGRGRDFFTSELPEVAVAFIEHFDRIRDGEPFTFDLDYPAEVAA